MIGLAELELAMTSFRSLSLSLSLSLSDYERGREEEGLVRNTLRTREAREGLRAFPVRVHRSKSQASRFRNNQRRASREDAGFCRK